MRKFCVAATRTGDRGAKLRAKRLPRSGSSATVHPRPRKLECRFPSSLGRGTLSLEGEPEFHQFVTTFLEVFV